MSSSYGLGQVWIEWFWSVGNLKLTSGEENIYPFFRNLNMVTRPGSYLFF